MGQPSLAQSQRPSQIDAIPPLLTMTLIISPPVSGVGLCSGGLAQRVAMFGDFTCPHALGCWRHRCQVSRGQRQIPPA